MPQLAAGRAGPLSEYHRPPSQDAVLLEGLRGANSCFDVASNGLFRTGLLQGLGNHGLDERGGDDDDSILIPEDDVARLDEHALDFNAAAKVDDLHPRCRILS